MGAQNCAILDRKRDEQKSCRDASAGNRTRGLRMASGDFTTKPLMLLDDLRQNNYTK